MFATGAALAVLAFPSAAVAASTPDTTPTASQQCKSLRTSMTVKVFNEAYGTNAGRANALGKCISKLNKAQTAGKAQAAETCRAERAAGETAFTAKYGTGRKGANAYGKCVSGKAKAAAAKAKAAELKASKTCKAERAAGAAAFAAKYATNASKSNAFGKCVSAAAKPAAPAA